MGPESESLEIADFKFAPLDGPQKDSSAFCFDLAEAITNKRSEDFNPSLGTHRPLAKGEPRTDLGFEQVPADNR